MSLKSGTKPGSTSTRAGPKGVFASLDQNKALNSVNKIGQSKYGNIRSVTDTGSSASKVAKADSDRLVAKKRDELFKRVRPQTLGVHLEALYGGGAVVNGGRVAGIHSINEDEECVYNLHAAVQDPSRIADRADAAGTVSHVYSEEAGNNYGGYGSDEKTVQQARSDQIMLLDTRDGDEFEVCHVRHAISFPKQQLANDKVTPQLHTFKNLVTDPEHHDQARYERDSTKRLVVYDLDDKSTAKIATMLIEKVFKNVYALSGGIEEVVLHVTEMVEGDYGEIVKKMQAQGLYKGLGGSASSGRSVKSSYSGRPNTGSSVASGASRFTQR